MESKAIVTGADGNRLFDGYLSQLNTRIMTLEQKVAELERDK